MKLLKKIGEGLISMASSFDSRDYVIYHRKSNIQSDVTKIGDDFRKTASNLRRVTDSYIKKYCE